MRLLSSALLIFCTTILLFTSLATATDAVRVVDGAASLQQKPVRTWTVRDVEAWMQETIGYSEYCEFIRKHLIDGLTLTEMSAADFESFFPIENPLHVIKIMAHVRNLQGRCACGEEKTSPVGFWAYMRAHPRRVWIEGTTAVFFPRVAMLQAYFFDHSLYLDMVGRSLTPEEVMKQSGATESSMNEATLKHGTSSPYRVASLWRASLYWISWLVMPDLYLAYQAGSVAPHSYFILLFIALHFIFQACNEYVLMNLIYKGLAFEEQTSWLSRVWIVFSYTLFLPLAGVLVAFLFPLVLQYLCATALFLHSLMTMFGFVVLMVQGSSNTPLSSSTTTEEEKAAAPKAEEREASKLDKQD